MTRSIMFCTSSYYSYTFNLECELLRCTACYNSIKNNGLNPTLLLTVICARLCKNKFQKNYYKLVNNSVYGKTIESTRRGLKVEITRIAGRAEKLVSKLEFKRIKIFWGNMAAMCSKPKIINWKTPTIVGASVFDLAKIYMYRLHYYVLRADFSCRLLYSDLDSLLYKVESEDLYYELEKQTQDVKNEFHFSYYLDDHALHNDANKCNVLKFKDEFSGDIISEFICLKPKMYSITSKG